MMLLVLALAPLVAAADPDQAADALIAQMTLDEKIQLVHGGYTFGGPAGPNNAEEWVTGIPRLGIPDILYSDGPNGVVVGPGTALPSSMASAASWDLDEARRYGQVIGAEVRAAGMDSWLGGNVNLVREPRDGRTFETAGEDPLLAGSIKAAHLAGVQDANLIGTIKHYALNDQETGRLMANSVIGERAARESDLLAFEIALKESGAQSVMCSYNLINGTYACQNDHALNGVLKVDWRFPGYVQSDALATQSSVTSAMAGLDQEEPGGFYFGGLWGESLKDAIQSGAMPEARLDDMVHRILRAMFAAGVMANPPAMGTIDADGDAGVARDALAAGAVLLKNANGLLPLLPVDPAKMNSIAVIGGHADAGVLSGGGSAQVMPIGGAALTLAPECPATSAGISGVACHNASEIYDPSSPLAAIRALATWANVQYADGTDAAAAAALAKASSVAIVFVTVWTSEGMDLDDLSLPNGQDALVSAVAAANPNTVVVIESGGPVIMPWLDQAGAVLEAWYPGQRGGEVIANILFGTMVPSGKLPLTFPKSVADLPRPTIPAPADPTGTAPFDVDYNLEGFNVGYKWFDARGIEPLFPFGYGLSYTTFAITNARMTPVTDSAAPGFEVSFDVQNTGTRGGAEVAQVYVGLPAATGEPPKRLVAWQKVGLITGYSQHVSISVSASDVSHPMSYWDARSRSWRVARGEYVVYVGNSSRNLAEAGRFYWRGPHGGGRR